MGHGWTGGGSPLLQNGILARRSVLVAQWARSDGAVGVGPRAGCGARLATGDLSAGDSLRERRGAAARLGPGASRCNDSDNGSDSGANGDSHSGRHDAGVRRRARRTAQRPVPDIHVAGRQREGERLYILN